MYAIVLSVGKETANSSSVLDPLSESQSTLYVGMGTDIHIKP